MDSVGKGFDKYELVEVQDSAGENSLLSLCRLTKVHGRIGIDAIDENGNPYELKTTTKSSLSTARDTSLASIQTWRKKFWLTASGKRTRAAFIPREVYFCTPKMLEPEFLRIEAKLLPVISVQEEAYLLAQANGMSLERLKILKASAKRAATLNDPNINWSFIQKHGIRIETDHANRLRELVAEFGLEGIKPPRFIQRSALDYAKKPK